MLRRNQTIFFGLNFNICFFISKTFVISIFSFDIPSLIIISRYSVSIWTSWESDIFELCALNCSEYYPQTSSLISYSFDNIVAPVSNFEERSDLYLYTLERHSQNALSVLSCVSWILHRNSCHLFDFYFEISIFTSRVNTRSNTLVSSFVLQICFSPFLLLSISQ